jgi:hypothetical protein
MSKRFNDSLIAYGKQRIKELKPGRKKGSPKKKVVPLVPTAGCVPPGPLPSAAGGTETEDPGQTAPGTIGALETKDAVQTMTAAAEGLDPLGAGQTA